MRIPGIGTAVVIIIAGALLGACQKGSSRRCADDSQCEIGSTCGEDRRCAARACTVDRECPAGSVCDDARCEQGCRSSLDCPAGAGICDTKRGALGTCVACLATSDCAAGRECRDNACIQPCRDDADCDSKHCDTKARACVACLEDAHCTTGTVSDDHACVNGCGSDAACPASTPRCAPDMGAHGVCVQCRGDADCGAGGRCRSDGACVNRALDVLFVVDNSADTLKAQADLARGFPRFLAALEVGGVLPDLQIGVISTDLGTGPEIVTNCSTSADQDGDGGALQHAATVAGCTPPTGAFLRDVAGAAGRERNYSGTLAEAFTCISQLGERGCGFEQTLASMRKALDGTVAENAGFLRPNAALAVFILTNEDDCSATDTALYRESNTALGPLHSFRCFEAGVRCEPDDPRAVGAKSSCKPRTPPQYMASPESYVEFLRGLRPPGRLAVSVLAIPNRDLEVIVDTTTTGRPLQVKYLCKGATPRDDHGTLAVRLEAFAGGFGKALDATLCTADVGAVLERFGAESAALLN